MNENAFSELDENGDKTLSYEEVKSAISDPAEFDVNEDQVISREEFLQHSIAGKQTAPVLDAQIEWATRQIAKYDKNKDGKLTIDEWSSMTVKSDGADANGDGAITAEEFAKFRTLQK